MSKKRTIHFFTTGLFAAAFAGPLCGQASFHEVPKANGGGTFLEAAMLGLSPDGSVAVGRDLETAPANYRPTMWSKATGLVVLDHLPGFVQGAAFEASDAGQVIVGLAGDGGPGTRAVMWDTNGAATDLGVAMPGDDRSIARGVNLDGTVIVGVSGPPDVAFRWTSATGMQPIGVPDGFNGSDAYAVSFDGSVIVGDGGIAPFGLGAWRWSESDGFQNLGSLGGAFPFTRAMGVSGNGQVVIGNGYNTADNFEAFRWDAQEGMVGLGFISSSAGQPWTDASYANGGVNYDGSVIVGGSSTEDAPSEAFIWDSDNGMRSIKRMLEDDYDLDLTGWTLEEAQGLSADGRTISGWGRNPAGERVGWVAKLPADCTFADLNCDGVVDGADLLILLSAWGKCDDPDDCPTDLNDDGIVDGGDLLILLSNWG